MVFGLEKFLHLELRVQPQYGFRPKSSSLTSIWVPTQVFESNLNMGSDPKNLEKSSPRFENKNEKIKNSGRKSPTNMSKHMTKNIEELHLPKNLQIDTDIESWEDNYDDADNSSSKQSEPMTQEAYEGQFFDETAIVPSAVPDTISPKLERKRKEFDEDLTGAMNLDTLFSLVEEIKRPQPSDKEMDEAYTQFLLDLKEMKRQKKENDEKIHQQMITALQNFCKSGGVVSGSTVEEHYSSMLLSLKKKEDELLEKRRKTGVENVKSFENATFKKAVARYSTAKPNAKGKTQGVKKVEESKSRGAKRKARDISFVVKPAEKKVAEQPKIESDLQEEEEPTPMLIAKENESQIFAEPLVLIKVQTVQKVDETIGFSRPLPKINTKVNKTEVVEEGWSKVASKKTEKKVEKKETLIKNVEASLLSNPMKQQTAFLKTRLCDSIVQGVKCRHGSHCRFAHTVDELVKRECTFGSRCRYVWNTQAGYTNQPCPHTGKICIFWHPNETSASYEKRLGISKSVQPPQTPRKIIV